MTIRTTIMTAVLSLVGGTAALAQTKPFSLKGLINGHEGKTIYFYYARGEEMITDSAIVSGNAFEFKGELTTPYAQATIAIEPPTDNYYERHQEAYSYFYIEPGNLSVSLNVYGMDHPIVIGSKTQTESDELDGLIGDEYALFSIYNKEYRSNPDSIYMEALDKVRERASRSYEEKNIQFIASHPDSYISINCLRLQMSDMSLDSLRNIYNSFSDRVKADENARDVADEIAARERIEPGKPAPLFTATDINGKEFSLESLRGKYVVLDFWASWCVPCRQSNPHMKQLYAKYADKGLDFVYVSDDDSNPDKWRKAVETDGLEAFHHVLRGLKVVSNKPYKFDKTNDISEKYAIHYLPTKFLIDREGNMVGKFDSDELDKKLQEIFGY